METSVRLQKFMASCGVASRRRCEALIAEGRVRVNGRVVTEPGVKIDADTDAVEVDGRVISSEECRLYRLNKPARVVSTMSDEHGRPCVGDLVKHLPVSVFPIGRLDYDVTGLLLLTNDGDFANELLHPRYETIRVYRARVSGVPGKSALARLVDGVQLEDGPARARSAECIKEGAVVCAQVGDPAAGSSVVELAVSEGRNHFVKRILESVGHPVQRLCRVRFGPFDLESLAAGEIGEVQNYKEDL